MTSHDPPPPSPNPADDPLRELAELTRAVRAHLEFHSACGSFGIHAASDALKRSRWADLPEPAEPSHRADAGRVAPTRASQGASPSFSRAPPRAEAVASSAPAANAPKPSAASGPAPPSAEARERLRVLAEQAASCQKCSLHEGRTHAVFARGSGSSGVCFIGEGPGADEDAQGLPFVGKAGKLLDRMIAAMGLDRDDVYVCNIVKCRPPKNRKPDDSEMAACSPYLHEQIELVAPKVIVALGATAVQGLLGTSVGITRLRGQWRLYQGRIPVMPTFHPAYLLRNAAGKRDVWDDLQNVLRHLGREIPERGKR